mmetsp:Transcript_42556/g.133353  ORF Transcript_42556/g.133353 Transcript_42556/m.133353 type:complete len:349 (+) Transcript_42556:573-1619(+)
MSRCSLSMARSAAANASSPPMRMVPPPPPPPPPPPLLLLLLLLSLGFSGAKTPQGPRGQTMSGFQEAAVSALQGPSDIEDKLAKEYTTAEPKIDAALRNHLAYCVARGQVHGDGGLPMAKAHACTRALSLAINQLMLPDPVTWGAEHPQAESQSASDRLDELARYGILQRLLASVKKAGPGAKPTKLFGRQLLTVRGVREQVLAAAKADIERRRGAASNPNPNPSPILNTGGGLPEPEEADAFFDEFLGSVDEAEAEEAAADETPVDAEVDVSAAAEGDDEDEQGEEPLGRLIWSQNFEQELRERRARRFRAAEQRKHREAASEAAAQQLRDAVAGAAAAADGADEAG